MTPRKYCYTGFPDYASLRACFDYLGPAVNQLSYWSSISSADSKKKYWKNQVFTASGRIFLKGIWEIVLAFPCLQCPVYVRHGLIFASSC